MSKISEAIKEYLVKHTGDEEKIHLFAEFIEHFFDDLDDENREIKHAFKEDVEDFVLEVNKDFLEKIVKSFKHKDNTESGIKWTCEEVDAVAKQYEVATKVETYGKEYKLIYFWFLMNYVYAVHFNPARNVQGYIETAIDEYCNKVVCFKDMIRHLAENFEEKEVLK